MTTDTMTMTAEATEALARSNAERSIATAFDLSVRLRNTFDSDKPVLVDTGDGIFTVHSVNEEDHEVVICLGPMP